MGLRSPARASWTDWLGLNSFANPENLRPDWWTDCNNIVVNETGSAQVLRTPGNLNQPLSTGNLVLSIFGLMQLADDSILFDIEDGSTVSTYHSDGTTNTLLRSGQAQGNPFVRLMVHDFAHGINGDEFMQTDGTNVWRVGIDAPLAAPTTSFSGGGTGAYVSGVTVSYAYRNATTKHVGKCSDPSAASGASGANQNLVVNVVASTQDGVGGIVLFITEDDGAIRYLEIDSNGDPVVYPNTTGAITVDIGAIILDTLTQETFYNDPPPTGAKFMFKWKDRHFLVGFFNEFKSQIQFSGYETTFIGQPWEAWPPLNVLNIPNHAERAMGGVGTILGALILSDRDAYLLSGYPTDKTEAPQATITVSEHLEPMGWRIGTRSPRSIQTTPFGEIWLDHAKRIRLWDHNGAPREIGLPMRDKLAQIPDDETSMRTVDSAWLQYSDFGGIYILTAPVDNSQQNKQLYLVSIYTDPETQQAKFACAVSDVQAHCTQVVRLAGKDHLLIGVTDRLRTFLDFTAEGVGWNHAQMDTTDPSTRFFEFWIGNEGEFSYFRNLRFDASNISGLRIFVSPSDQSEGDADAFEIFPELESNSDSSYIATIDFYGRRAKVRFEYDATDCEDRQIYNMRVASSQKSRIQ